MSGLSAKNGFLTVETFHVIVLLDESGQEAESLGQSWQEATCIYQGQQSGQEAR